MQNSGLSTAEYRFSRILPKHQTLSYDVLVLMPSIEICFNLLLESTLWSLIRRPHRDSLGLGAAWNRKSIVLQLARSVILREEVR